MMTEQGSEADKIVWWGIILGLVVWLIGISWFGFSWNRLPPELPLFYSLPRGEQQLISKGWFLAILITSGLIFTLNLGLAYGLGKGENLLRRFLVWGGVATL